MLRLGIDIGSKTIKLVILDKDNSLLYESYERHLSNVQKTLSYLLHNALKQFPNIKFIVGITGSAGMQIANELNIEFFQEVVACRKAIKELIPKTDVAIEIGGEDSKILFLSNGEELRMNSTCAGGTGGFIDTIAGMLDLNAEKLNYYAHGCKTIYPIASRCAVFAQTDVRPLLNKGVSKEDIAGSVFDAVAVQCISGLACGRTISGNVAFLGGPLHFLSALRDRFIKRLNLNANNSIIPEDGHLFVAMGTALLAKECYSFTLEQLHEKVVNLSWGIDEDLSRLPALFNDKKSYDEFLQRHQNACAPRKNIMSYEGPAYLGVDSGSEAIKYVLVDKDGAILRTYYKRGAGDLFTVASEMLIDLWKHIPRKPDGTPTIYIAYSTVTGYGEDYLKEAFSFDFGVVETVAHMQAAKSMCPDVDFILDIGGQDIKCLYLQGGELENVVLNEACSSGCGALLSGTAWSMNVKFDKFLEEALFAKKPIDLGTRCTVFMTSRVRHAQKSGASLGDISAGLAYSVIRNAIYKVIRVQDFSLLGNNILVQGGTFLNDAVLRAFEQLSGKKVIRPDIAGHMGAYGAALIAKSLSAINQNSTLLNRSEIENLSLEQENSRCDLCTNNCFLTTTTFSTNGVKKRFTVGNKCERGALKASKQKHTNKACSNLYKYKEMRVFKNSDKVSNNKKTIGIIRALDMYEYFPFWHGFLEKLGFNVVISDQIKSSRSYSFALETVPSESVCYPAKLMHVHVVNLLEKGVKNIFAPIIKEGKEGKLICPVVSGYPFVIKSNIPKLKELKANVITPELPINPYYLDANNKQMFDLICELFKSTFFKFDKNINKDKIHLAILNGQELQNEFYKDIANAGNIAYKKLKKEQGKGIVLAGRPYHTDPAIHHEIPALLNSFGFSVFTEDSIRDIKPNFITQNAKFSCNTAQNECYSSWECSQKIIDAAIKTSRIDNLDFIELTSFGCGIDAMYIDKTRDIIENANKIFTILKVDEIADLASIRIRIRSMMAAQDSRRKSLNIKA